jgi:hypothetical protein
MHPRIAADLHAHGHEGRAGLSFAVTRSSQSAAPFGTASYPGLQSVALEFVLKRLPAVAHERSTSHQPSGKHLHRMNVSVDDLCRRLRPAVLPFGTSMNRFASTSARKGQSLPYRARKKDALVQLARNESRRPRPRVEKRAGRPVAPAIEATRPRFVGSPMAPTLAGGLALGVFASVLMLLCRASLGPNGFLCYAAVGLGMAAWLLSKRDSARNEPRLAGQQVARSRSVADSASEQFAMARRR